MTDATKSQFADLYGRTRHLCEQLQQIADRESLTQDEARRLEKEANGISCSATELKRIALGLPTPKID